MPNWTRLAPLPCETWHTKAVAKKRDQLNASIARILEVRGNEDAYQAKMHAADVRSLDSGEVFQADCPELNAFNLLQSELQLREQIAAYFTAEAVDQRAAFDQAFAAHQSAADELRRKLIELGYVDSPHAVPGWIQPGFILTHPGVRAAKEYAESLRSPRTALVQDNNAAMQTLVEQLDKLRTRAVR